MKKWMPFFLIFLAAYMLYGGGAVGSAEDNPIFLLGENEKLTIVPTEGKTRTLELGVNPVTVLTGSKGQKIVICAGSQKSSGQVEQGASLRLLDQSLTQYDKVIRWDSKLTAYTVNKEATVGWFALCDGVIDKTKVEAKVCRVDLETFAIQEFIVDSTPSDIELSGDGKWLAITTLGQKTALTSSLSIVEANTMQPKASFDLPKNPGALCFSEDGQSLIAACYGYRKGLEVKSPYFEELKGTVPSGALVVDLSTMQGKTVGLGEVNREFLLGRNAMVYGISAQEKSGVINAVGPGGLAWSKPCDFAPLYIQETPDSNRLLITGANRVSVLERATGQSIKELTAEKDLGPWVFPEGAATAYAYNPSDRQLNIMDLTNLELAKPQTAGSAGLAALRAFAVVLSFAQYGMGPQYVNGVRIPTYYYPIYWAHQARGNIIACPEQKKLFMLNSFLSQYYTFDLEKGVVNPKKNMAGDKTLYLQATPNGKYLVVVGGGSWRLINTVTDQVDLVFFPNKLQVRFVFQEPTAAELYFSPDGNKMYIPAGGKVNVIDLQTGKELQDIKSQAKDAIVCW